MGLNVAEEHSRDASQGPPGTPVFIWQRTWELKKLLELYRERAPRKVLDLGTFQGGTLYHWLRNAALGATVWSVDQIARPIDIDSWTPEGVSVELIVASTGSIYERAQRCGPWDWVFIDADHAYDPARIDFEQYRRIVSPGGILALHDILPTSNPNIKVDRLWGEIQRAGYVTQELVADPKADWGGIGIVYL